MTLDNSDFYWVILFSFIIKVYKIVTAEENQWKFVHKDKHLKRNDAVWRIYFLIIERW